MKIEIPKHSSESGYAPPYYRKLRGYAFDPSFSATLNRRRINEVIYKIKWEPTHKGPVGEYVAVIDYNPTQPCFYKPVALDDAFVLADHGLAPSDGDPRFHQQQVYAVVMSVIHQFEKALGRKIIWSKLVRSTSPGSEVKASQTEYINTYVQWLTIFPHAMNQQNAFFSPKKNALLFGFFKAGGGWNGNNVPGATVFTCLSPDIVAHETAHAILHTVHPYLTKPTNTDMLAFHEGFADIIALLQRFTFKAVVEDQIRSSRGDMLSPENMLGDLAIQFGQAVSPNRRALRSFLVEKDEAGRWRTMTPDPTRFHTETEPHTRGGLLVAAVFDAFTRLYKYRVADLIRLASNGSGVLAPGEIDPDLVSRLAEEACNIAEKLMLICIRALDYCPPVDLSFGDYLRALVTADLQFSPEDEGGLRYAMMESFRSWGIVPQQVNTFSIESLKWKSPDELLYQLPGGHKEHELQLEIIKRAIREAFDPVYYEEKESELLAALEDGELSANEKESKKRAANKENETGLPLKVSAALGTIERILREDKREKIFQHSQVLAAYIHDHFKQKLDQPGNPERLLGLNFSDFNYSLPHSAEDKESNPIILHAPARCVFQVYKCRPMIVPDPQSGNSIKVMLIMFIQKVKINLKGSKYQGLLNKEELPFYGGSSLLIDMATYRIKYLINKPIISNERLCCHLTYAADHQSDLGAEALMMQEKEPFAALHIH